MNVVAIGRGFGWVAGFGVALSLSSWAADPLATWHVRTSPTIPSSENFEGVAYGNGRWVVVGEDGTILGSPDGLTWEPESNPIAPTGFKDLVFGQGTFVAVGSQSGALVTSSDGRTWVPGSLGMSGVQEVIHDGTRFIALAAGGFIGISTNGIAWEANGKVPVKYVDVGGIAFGNGMYVEIGYKRTGKPTDLHSSPDLETWTFRDANSNENMFNVGFGLGLFVGVGQRGTLITSPNGIQWTPRNANHTGFIWDVACDGRRLVAAAQWGRVLVSSDGIDWTRVETDLPGHLTDVAFGRDTFVAVGWDGQIVQSDPVEVVAENGGEIRLVEPAWSGGHFSFSFPAVAGKTYGVQSSTDGRTWEDAATVKAESTTMRVTDLQAAGGHRLYRVAIR